MTPPTGKFFGMLGGVAVVANNTWAAFQGKLSLEIEWDFGDNKATIPRPTIKKLTNGY